MTIDGIQTDEKNRFPITVRTPDSLVYKGMTSFVSSANSKGTFDILAEHANMITMVEKQPIEIEVDGALQRYSFEKAVIAIKNGGVEIFGDIQSNSYIK